MLKYTREDLHTIYLENIQNKEKIVHEYVSSIMKDIIYTNSKGETKYNRKIWKEDSEILEKIINKLKEIFVDSAIGIYEDGNNFSVISIDWTRVEKPN